MIKWDNIAIMTSRVANAVEKVKYIAPDGWWCLWCGSSCRVDPKARSDNCPNCGAPRHSEDEQTESSGKAPSGLLLVPGINAREYEKAIAKYYQKRTGNQINRTVARAFVDAIR